MMEVQNAHEFERHTTLASILVFDPVQILRLHFAAVFERLAVLTTNGCINVTMKMRRKILLFILLAFSLWLLILAIKSPSNDENWQPQFQILPTVELQNDFIRIKNVRDYRYNDNDTIAEIRYLDESYQLSEFKHAWYGLSHFGGNGLAHVFLSFEFSDNKFLVVSIEARLEEKHVEGYSPIKGLFRGYSKTIVLATEQDVIGLRTHIRGEAVYLHKLDLPELYTKPLLLNFLREAQALTMKPTFYNTLIDNCMTGLLAQSDRFRSVWSWFDTRILLPGFSDEIAYELGYINNTKSLNEVRKEALIAPGLMQIDDADFSQKIRTQ